MPATAVLSTCEQGGRLSAAWTEQHPHDQHNYGSNQYPKAWSRDEPSRDAPKEAGGTQDKKSATHHLHPQQDEHFVSGDHVRIPASAGAAGQLGHVLVEGLGGDL